MSYSWIQLDTVLAIHDHQLAAHGGSPGIRDMSLIERALARPKNTFHYEGSDAATLAAEYGSGLARNHGFIDGNKRTAYVVTRLFLKLHGLDFSCAATSRVLIFESMAAGSLGKEDFFAWMKENTCSIE